MEFNEGKTLNFRFDKMSNALGRICLIDDDDFKVYIFSMVIRSKIVRLSVTCKIN